MFNLDVTTLDGENKKLEVIAVFHSDKHKYIAYNDGTESNGKLNVIVSRYIEHDGTVDLFEVETAEEWKFINDYLNEHVFGGEDID